MRAWDLNSGAVRIEEAMKDLNSAKLRIAELWNDKVYHEFKNHLEPSTRSCRTLEAIRRMAECWPRRNATVDRTEDD